MFSERGFNITETDFTVSRMTGDAIFSKTTILGDDHPAYLVESYSGSCEKTKPPKLELKL